MQILVANLSSFLPRDTLLSLGLIQYRHPRSDLTPLVQARDGSSISLVRSACSLREHLAPRAERSLTLKASASTFATSPTGVAGDAGVPGGGAGGVAPDLSPGAMPGGRGAGGVAAGVPGDCIATRVLEARNLIHQRKERQVRGGRPLAVLR
jgi:hypothetical protein